VSSKSERMMDLLQELALIKELDQQYEIGLRSEVEIVEFERRQDRRVEIGGQIKALAEPPA
jgi:hypothetical protein